MQANCPHCSYKITIDDARVPERAFSVKCPKCQNAVKFPGKAAAPPAAPAPAVAAGPAAPTPPPRAAEEPAASVPSIDVEEMRSQMMAQIRREMTVGGEAAHSGERALVALPDRGLAGNVALALSRMGYAVDPADDVDEAARLLEQGVYTVTVTAPVAGTGNRESLYQRALRLPQEARRKMFLVVVADSVKTGDGIHAFVLQADLAVSTRDVAHLETQIRKTLDEKTRLYRVYLEARRRADAEAGY
jgi:predicted Zn finger-like uncharacterized protein